MKKYKLFSEHCDQEIYGDTMEAALLDIGFVYRPAKWAHGREVAPVRKVIIKSVEGIENTDNSCRGDKKFIRVICLTEEGILSIDGMELTTEIRKAGQPSKYGEPTKTMRIPISRIGEVEKLLITPKGE